MNWDEAVEQLLAGEITSWTDRGGRTYGRQHALNVLGYNEARRRGLLRDYLESRHWGRAYLAWSRGVDQLIAGEITEYEDHAGRIYTRDDAIRCLGHDKAEQRGVLDEYIKLRDGHAGI